MENNVNNWAVGDACGRDSKMRSYCCWIGNMACSLLRAENVPSSTLWHALISIKWSCHWKHGSHTWCTVSFSFPPSLFCMTLSHTKNRTALGLLLPWSFSSHVIGKMDGSEWEWVSCWRWTEQYFLLQWWYHFKWDYSICCYQGVSPGKITRSQEFHYNFWLMGRSVFMTIASLCFHYNKKEAYLDILRIPIFLKWSRWPWTIS